MSEKIGIPVETFQKMVSYIELTGPQIEKSAAAEQSMKKAANRAAEVLAADGLIPAEKKASLAQNIVADASQACEVIVKMAEELKTARAEAQQAKKQAQELVPAVGAPELNKAASSTGGKKESDLAWERGFQL